MRKKRREAKLPTPIIIDDHQLGIHSFTETGCSKQYVFTSTLGKETHPEEPPSTKIEPSSYLTKTDTNLMSR